MDATIHKLADKSLDLCIDRGWSREWPEAGCYLHGEVTEFIRDLKSGRDVVEEAGDILIVLLSTLRYHRIDIDDVLSVATNKVESLLENDGVKS